MAAETGEIPQQPSLETCHMIAGISAITTESLPHWLESGWQRTTTLSSPRDFDRDVYGSIQQALQAELGDDPTNPYRVATHTHLTDLDGRRLVTGVYVNFDPAGDPDHFAKAEEAARAVTENDVSPDDKQSLADLLRKPDVPVAPEQAPEAEDSPETPVYSASHTVLPETRRDTFDVILDVTFSALEAVEGARRWLQARRNRRYPL